ncbi:lysophosphatidic acid phosphatase type 6-like [Paramacrobiotus metropolitanus]|uniref:lysophosphatidic acid phosphatase type 6-like n=1 Tax=Paramacrobiotus metropolitanus TaxID=2943436 RepID=UPI002445CAD9|nr:lysophosphatidic acid phosphatase type 6-like [Paramacrobiotus metropolitanus]
MWNWRRIGVVGAVITGSSGLFSPPWKRTVHADAASVPTDPSQPHGVSRERPQTPVFDTDGSEIRDINEDNIPRSEELQLRNVQAFFRHGARTPLRILKFLDQPEWPKEKMLADPLFPAVTYTVLDLHGQQVPVGPYETMYQKILFKGGSPAGQLTKTGKLQMYELGQRYRKQYIEDRRLVRPIFDATQVYIRSTNMTRTIESCRWVLSGMFGNNIRRGDAIIIYTEPAEREILYPNHTFCLQLKTLNKKAFKALDDLPGLKKDRLEMQKLFNYAEENSKKNLNFVDLRDELIAREAHGLKLPDIIASRMAQIESYAVKMLTFMVSDATAKIRPNIMRLFCGPVLHLIRDNIDYSLEQEDYFRLQLYACHDSMLMALLVALDIFDDKWPPFGADLVFETYEDKNGDAWVRVVYQGAAQRLPGNGGAELIALDRFKRLIGRYTITMEEYRETCQDVARTDVARAVGGSK